MTPKAPGRIQIVQMDELWSFAQNKENKQWVWLALDAETSAIVGCFIGDYAVASCRALWDLMPALYRETTTYSPIFGRRMKASYPAPLIKPEAKKPPSPV